MWRYFEAVSRVCERHGGTVEKFIGDAVMAVFGVPTAHEDHALRAVRAAAELQEALAELNDELEREWGVRIAIRTGVNSGEVVAGDPAGGQALVTGDAVNVAARLEQAAARRRDPDRRRDAPAGGGRRRARAARAARGARQETSRSRPGGCSTSARGRASSRAASTRRCSAADASCGLLREAFERVVARAQRRSASTVLGPAGIGKSRLAHGAEGGAVATARPCLIGSCLPYGEGITFWPLAEIVRQLAGETIRAPRSRSCWRTTRTRS